MLQIDYNKWNENPLYLRDLGLNSPHIRTRERFLALYSMFQFLSGNKYKTWY